MKKLKLKLKLIISSGLSGLILCVSAFANNPFAEIYGESDFISIASGSMKALREAPAITHIFNGDQGTTWSHMPQSLTDTLTGSSASNAPGQAAAVPQRQIFIKNLWRLTPESSIGFESYYIANRYTA